MSHIHRRKGSKRAQNKSLNGKASHHSTAFKRSDTVHINNLPPNIDEAEIVHLLKMFGPIEDILIHKPRAQQQIPGGKDMFTFAFVNFVYPGDASRCISSSIPIEIRGRKVTFNTRKLAGEKIITSSGKNVKCSAPKCGNISDTSEKNFLSLDPWPTHSFGWAKESRMEVTNMSPLAKVLRLPSVPESPGRPASEPTSEANSSTDTSSSLMVNVNSNKPVIPEEEIESECKSIMLADRIPSSWSSRELYYRLKSFIPNVTSVLLYKDYDERGFVQGLIQLSSEPLCRLLCSQGTLIIEGAQLELMHSEVKSIGQLRRRYSGNFSIFEPHCGGSLELKKLPLEELQQDRFIYPDNSHSDDYWDHMAGDRSISSGPRAHTSGIESESPVDAQDFTPSTEFTPSTDIYCDDRGTCATVKQAQFILGTRKQSEFATFVPTAPPHDGQLAPVNKPIKIHTKNVQLQERMQIWPAVATCVPVDRILPMVASSTIIIDNIESGVKENLQSQLERLDHHTGGSASVNIVRVGERYRAFICYSNPNQAHTALAQFQQYYASKGVEVRFA